MNTNARNITEAKIPPPKIPSGPHRKAGLGLGGWVLLIAASFAVGMALGSPAVRRTAGRAVMGATAWYLTRRALRSVLG